jgi:putative toxin-antitoxin system antitoxin component (TIGR02293 family)
MAADRKKKAHASGKTARKTRLLVREQALTLYGQYFRGDPERVLRGYDLGADLGVADAIEAGVSTDAVEDVIESGLVDAGVIYELVIPRRTLAYRKASAQALTPQESDRLARVLRVHARAEDVLGDPEGAYRWLRKPNRALKGRRPLELLASEAGARAVEKVLGRIEHGVFS